MRLLRLLALLYLLSAVAAQCELWAGEPSICAGVLTGRTIYIGSSSQAQIASDTSVISYLSAVSDPCKSDALKFACLRYFAPCNDAGSLPQRPCQALCTTFFSSCSSEIAQYAALLTGIVPANCSVVDDAGTPLFPDGTYTDAGVELNCTVGVSGAVQASCPKPLKPYPNPACMIPCPYTFNTPAQFDAMRYLTLILGLFSFLFEMFLIPAYGLFPLARRWPARLLLYYFIANFLGMTGILISWRGESVWCKDNNDTHTSVSNRLCGVQGALVMFSVLSFELWWMCLIGNLCYTLYLKKYFPIKDLYIEVVMHIICWGYPLVPTIKGLKTGRIEFVQDSPSCFLRGEQADFLVWYPMTAIFSLGIVLMAPVVFYVTRNAGSFGLRRQFRFLSLIAYNTLLFSFFVALWGLGRHKGDLYNTVVENYILCILSGGGGCHLTPQPPFALRIILYSLLGASGMVFSLLFLSDGALIGHWKKSWRERRLPWSFSTASTNSSRQAPRSANSANMVGGSAAPSTHSGSRDGIVSIENDSKASAL